MPSAPVFTVGERGRVRIDLAIRGSSGRSGACSSRLSVLLPASAAHSDRFGSVGEPREHRVVAPLVVALTSAQPSAMPTIRCPTSPDAVLHPVLLPLVGTARCHPLPQPDRPAGVPQQQRSGLRAHGATVEPRHHPRTVRRYTPFASDPAHESGKPLSHHHPRSSGPMHLLPCDIRARELTHNQSVMPGLDPGIHISRWLRSPCGLPGQARQ